MDFVIVPVYCGHNFKPGSNTTNFRADDMDGRIAKLCGVSNYFEGLKPFGANNVTVKIPGYILDFDVPASWANGQAGFTDNNISDLLKSEVLPKANYAPGSFGSRTPIYIVIVKQGQKCSDHPGDLGYHKALTWSGSEVLWAWAYQGDDVQGTMPTVSHEAVEAITAKLGYGERCDPCVMAGFGATVGNVNVGSDLAVDPYLSAFGHCIAPYTFSQPIDDVICMAWKGSTDSTIWWSTLNSFKGNDGTTITKWDHPAYIPGVGTSHSPAMAVHDGVLWMVWKGLGDDEQIYTSYFKYGVWSPQSVIPGARTSSHPALASFDGNLYAFWKGDAGDTHVWWSIFAVGSWSSLFMMSDRATSRGVTVVAGRDLHMFWRGADDDQNIWWSKLGRGLMYWTDQRPLQGWTSDTPSVAPALQFTSGPDTLLLTWKGADGDASIWQAGFDGGNWTPQSAIANVATNCGPAIAGDSRGRLWRVWRGADDDTQIWWSFSGDGGRNWSGQQTVMDSIGHDGVFDATTSHQPAVAIISQGPLAS